MKAYVYMKTYMGLLVELYPKLPKLRTTQMPLSLKVCKLWYIHSIDHKSALERNKLLIQATTWINLKNNAKWKIQNSIYSMIPFIWHSGKGRTIVLVIISVVAQRWERHKENLRVMVIVYISLILIWLYAFVKTHRTGKNIQLYT